MDDVLYKFVKEFKNLTKTKSINKYDGSNESSKSSSNMFTTSNDGKYTLAVINNDIYKEDWTIPKSNKIKFSMNDSITAISADFINDLLVSGDKNGYIFIQKIFSNNSSFYKKISNTSQILSLNILNGLIVIGNNSKEVYKVDMNLEKKKEVMVMKTKGNSVLNLRLGYNILKSNQKEMVLFANSSKI